jgi:hypothetical protein
MFNVFCTQHDSEMILGPNAMRGMANTDLGIIVVLECSCGERIAALTGRKATHERSVTVPAGTQELAERLAS